MTSSNDLFNMHFSFFFPSSHVVPGMASFGMASYFVNPYAAAYANGSHVVSPHLMIDFSSGTVFPFHAFRNVYSPGN